MWQTVGGTVVLHAHEGNAVVSTSVPSTVCTVLMCAACAP